MRSKNIFIAILAFMIASTAFAKVVTASGAIESLEFKVRSFDRLSVRSQFDVYLTQGDKEALRIETYKNLLPYVEIEQDNGTLNISLQRNLNRINWSGKKSYLKVYVTVKDLERLNLSGACDLYMLTDLHANDLKVVANGASDLSLKQILGNDISILTSGASDIDKGNIVANKIYINASGASDGGLVMDAKDIKMITSGASDFTITVNAEAMDIRAVGSSDFVADGNTKSIKVDVSGSSSFRGADLETIIAKIDASGSSHCVINVRESLEASSSGASTIYYGGNPESVSISVSGVSTIRKK